MKPVEIILTEDLYKKCKRMAKDWNMDIATFIVAFLADDTVGIPNAMILGRVRKMKHDGEKT